MDTQKYIEKCVDMAMKQALDDTTINDISIREWIDKITSGKYKPVIYAQWLTHKVAFMKTCSLCNCSVDFSHDYEFCPRCGATMIGGD